MNKEIAYINDFITGKTFVNTGAEENRQAVERFLVEKKGYAVADITVNAPISVITGEDEYRSFIDLLVSVGDAPVMVIKCAAGSLESRQREAVSAARILRARPVPLAVASDGKTAVIWETMTGKKIGEGLFAIPDPDAAKNYLAATIYYCIPENRLEKERIIFRSYDSMNVNICPRPSEKTDDRQGDR